MFKKQNKFVVYITLISFLSLGSCSGSSGGGSSSDNGSSSVDTNIFATMAPDGETCDTKQLQCKAPYQIDFNLTADISTAFYGLHSFTAQETISGAVSDFLSFLIDYAPQEALMSAIVIYGSYNYLFYPDGSISDFQEVGADEDPAHMREGTGSVTQGGEIALSFPMTTFADFSMTPKTDLTGTLTANGGLALGGSGSDKDDLLTKIGWVLVLLALTKCACHNP